MKKSELKELILECINEVILESKGESKKEEPKKKETKKEETKGEPKKSKGDAVAKPKPHEKAFADMTQNLTKKHGKVRAKQMLSKKVKSLDEMYRDENENVMILKKFAKQGNKQAIEMLNDKELMADPAELDEAVEEFLDSLKPGMSRAFPEDSMSR